MSDMSHGTLASASFARAGQLLSERQSVLHSKIDRTFALLLFLQWVAGIVAATWLTPLRSSGPVSQQVFEVAVAIVLGGMLALAPIWLAFARSGTRSARYAIAASQLLLSSLLIHLIGERIDPYLYVFGSLALLSLYMDWRVFVPAAAAFVAVQVLPGAVSPLPVIGFLIELGILVTLCVRAERNVRDAANQSADLEVTGQKYGAVLARSGEGICLLDPETKEILEANDTFWRLFRLDPGTINSGRLPVVELLPDPDRDGTPATRECQYRQADGSQLTFRVTVQSISYGSRDAFCAVVRDVTEHMRVQAALKDSEERYALAARGADDGLGTGTSNPEQCPCRPDGTRCWDCATRSAVMSTPGWAVFMPRIAGHSTWRCKSISMGTPRSSSTSIAYSTRTAHTAGCCAAASPSAASTARPRGWPARRPTSLLDGSPKSSCSTPPFKIR